MKATGATVDFSRSGVSRYIQLATIFRRKIESGEWSIGSQIPTVTELAEEWGVAPATIRQALDLLSDDGLIERFRAKGTFVMRQPQQELWCAVPTDWSGLLLAPKDAEIEVLEVEHDVLPPAMMQSTGAMVGSYRHWRRRHSLKGQAYYVGDAYVNEQWAQQIPHTELTRGTTLRLLKELPGLELRDVHQTLTVGAADAELSKLLDVPLNAPIARIRRSAKDIDGNVVFLSDGAYRGDVVRLDITVAKPAD